MKDKNVIIALIFGVSLVLSVFIYSYLNRYESYIEGAYVITLDKWTGDLEAEKVYSIEKD